ncbi:hypothetical protein ES703_46714 [subsurface metagenome]
MSVVSCIPSPISMPERCSYSPLRSSIPSPDILTLATTGSFLASPSSSRWSFWIVARLHSLRSGPRTRLKSIYANVRGLSFPDTLSGSPNRISCSSLGSYPRPSFISLITSLTILPALSGEATVPNKSISPELRLENALSNLSSDSFSLIPLRFFNTASAFIVFSADQHPLRTGWSFTDLLNTFLPALISQIRTIRLNNLFVNSA